MMILRLHWLILEFCF